MSTLRMVNCKLGVAVLSLLLEAKASSSALAWQYGAVGIVTYDPLPDPTAPEAHTYTTVVPVPYAWLMAHDPGVVHEYVAYEASAKASAANGRKVWECYALGLDPEVATNDFKIAAFPMKADGTPDLANIVFEPPQAQWNVPATYKVKGAATLDGPWDEVSSGGNPSNRFWWRWYCRRQRARCPPRPHRRFRYGRFQGESYTMTVPCSST